MNKKELFQEARKKISPEFMGTEEVEYAIDHLHKAGKFSSGPFYKKDIGELIEDIHSLASFYREHITQAKQERDEVPLSFFSVSDYIEKDLLIEKITPWVQETRQELFSQIEAPFKNDSTWKGFNEAIFWIEKKATEPLPKETQEKVDKFNEETRRIYEKLSSGEILGGFALQKNLLYYPGSDGWIHSVEVTGKKDLALLKKEAKEMAKATAFKEAFIVLFILTDIEPPFPAVRIKTSQHKNLVWGIARPYFSIEVNTHELSLEKLKEVYMQYYRAHKKKQKFLNREDLDFYRVVKECGTPPENGSKRKGEWTSYWKKVGKYWFGEENKHQAAYMKYKRLMEKIYEEEVKQ